MIDTPQYFGADPVQRGDVGAHEVEDFGGVEAVRAVAFEIDEPPQLIPGRPAQSRADEAALDPESDAAEEGDALARWDMSPDPAGGLGGATDERLQGQLGPLCV